jgi:hypothetical protein
MRINEELTDLIRGRIIELVSKEEGLVTIVFNDRSKLQISTTEAPDVNVLGENRIESVGEENGQLVLFGENERTAVYTLLSPGSSVTVISQDGEVEFEG